MAEVVGVLGPTADDLYSMKHNYHVTLVAMTILVYDFFLTFPAEVERFWLVGRVNCAICLFYLNRYLVFFGYVPILIENFWVNDQPTKLKVGPTYLWGRDLRVLVFLIIISALLLAFGCWAGFGYDRKLDVNRDILINVGCGVTSSRYRARRLAMTWGLLLIFDFTIFGMTLYKTIIFSRSNNNASTLITVFMRDGAMYFGIVAACNLGNILFLMLGGPLTRNSGVILSNAFSSVMITRMMLNLRDPTFIPVSDRNVSEDTTYPDLTYVESYYPTQLSDVRGGFTESESRGGDEAWDLDLHRPSVGHDIEELHRTSV